MTSKATGWASRPPVATTTWTPRVVPASRNLAPGMSDSGLTAALQALRLAARRSAVARRLDAGAEQDLLQTIVEATVALFEAEAASIALFERDPERLVYRVAAGAQGQGAIGLSSAAQRAASWASSSPPASPSRFQTC